MDEHYTLSIRLLGYYTGSVNLVEVFWCFQMQHQHDDVYHVDVE